jgi:hypothetical protein
VLCTCSQQPDTERSRDGAQRLVKRGKRKHQALRQFNIGCIVRRQRETVGQIEGGRPGVALGIRVDVDRQASKLGNGSVPETLVDALAADRRPQSVGNFEPPEPRYRCTLIGDAVEQGIGGGRPLVLEVSAQR